MQDNIQEIMGLVDAYGFAVIDVERARKAEKAIKALAVADSAYQAIQSKLRELVREPLSCDEMWDVVLLDVNPDELSMPEINERFILGRSVERAHNITSTSGVE